MKYFIKIIHFIANFITFVFNVGVVVANNAYIFYLDTYYTTASWEVQNPPFSKLLTCPKPIIKI